MKQENKEKEKERNNERWNLGSKITKQSYFTVCLNIVNENLSNESEEKK